MADNNFLLVGTFFKKRYLLWEGKNKNEVTQAKEQHLNKARKPVTGHPLFSSSVIWNIMIFLPWIWLVILLFLLLFVCAYYQLLSLDRGKKEHLTNLTFSCLSVKFLGH